MQLFRKGFVQVILTFQREQALFRCGRRLTRAGRCKPILHCEDTQQWQSTEEVCEYSAPFYGICACKFMHWGSLQGRMHLDRYVRQTLEGNGSVCIKC